MITFCYGSNSALGREQLWDFLKACSPVSCPWIILGDFNVVRWDSEKSGGAHPNSNWMSQFQRL